MFNPENVKRYVIESRGQGDPGSVYVLARDYNLLLDLAKDVMWQDYGDPDHHNPDNDNCVFCGGQRRNGHRSTCEFRNTVQKMDKTALQELIDYDKEIGI